MMSLGQKVIALAAILFLEALALAFLPVVGIVGLFFAIPMAIVILER